MLAGSQQHGITPFEIDPRPADRLWLFTTFVVLAIGGTGWWYGRLTEASLVAMGLYAIHRWWLGRQTIKEIVSAAERSGDDWMAMRQLGITEIMDLACSGGGGPLMRSANAVLFGVKGGAGGDTNAVVAAILARTTASVGRMFNAAVNGPRMGMLGTVVGLWTLFNAIELTDDPQKMVQSLFLALGGMELAVSTTALGLLIEMVLGNQATSAESSLEELHAQLNAQLSLLQVKE